jgi:hypothetical protein
LFPQIVTFYIRLAHSKTIKAKFFALDDTAVRKLKRELLRLAAHGEDDETRALAAQACRAIHV